MFRTLYSRSLAYLTENVAKFNKLPYSNAPTAYEGPVKEFYDTYSGKQATVYQTAVNVVVKHFCNTCG